MEQCVAATNCRSQMFFCIIHPGSKRSNTDLYKYVLNTHVLENVDVVRDLGVHVDCLLKFDRRFH